MHAATVPAGFTETLVAGGLANPTAMTFAPDGRLFVCEQAGRLRVIKDGALLPTPFATLSVHAAGERGLLGVAFDPDFSLNQYVYVYYTATTPTIHNRIGRLTASGDVALAGSEAVIFDLDPLSSDTTHNGGAIHFGVDGKLYVAVGDNGNGANAQALTSLNGKMLRINPDGTIPADNPFFGTASGKYRAIWARGLRNPFTFSVQPVTGAIFIDDVGENTWEEIDDGLSGANYGWPNTEGMTTDPRFQSPRYVYEHVGGACAITGGAFYNPSVGQFPADYLSDYFFADYCLGWIRKLDPAAGNTVAGFAAGISSPVDLKVSDDGSLYYLARGTGSTTGVVYRIDYGASAPTITTHPADQSARIGDPATFSVGASGSPPLSYQWQRNDANIPGATAASYTIASVTASDDGARFRAIVTNSLGSATSNEAVLTVTSNEAPTATITQPGPGTLYSGGDVITYSGTGTDPEDGTLPAGAFTWQVDFHHDAHTHPFILPTSGATGGSFTIPTTGETSANVWYRIYLTVRDSDGLTHTVQRDILPRKSRITLDTSPVGLQLKLDDQPITAPLSFDGVVGIVRNLEAVSPQTAGSVTWGFDSWSDGGAARHDISTPVGDTTYTATFVEAPTAPGLVGHWDMDAASVSGSTLSDRSGLGNHGTIAGAVVAPGIIGQSLAFDGVNDRVDVPGASALDTAAAFTVAFWYRADDNLGSIIAKPYGSDWLNSWQFEFDGPSSLSFTSADGVSQHFDIVPAPAVGAWTHVAGSWDGTTKRLFLNGALVLAVARSIAMETRDVVIGGDYNSGVFVLPFTGRVDEVRVYDRALSPAEVQQLYEAAFTPDSEPPSTPAGLTASAIGYSRVDLSWVASTDDVGVTGYRIFRQGVAIATTAGTSHSDVGLSPATTYSYEVTAFDAAGNESARSAAVMATTGSAPVLTSITVKPASATVPLGGTQAFTAEGRDQYGSPIATTVSWTVSGGGSIDASGRFTASSTGGPFVVTARDGAVSGTASVTVVADAGILEAHFDTGSDGFVYLDDAFRGTSRPGYASGLRSASEGFSGGGLKVTLGGIDDTTVLGMSGGWRRSFTLPSAGPVTLSFRYKLSQAANYEPDELSEALVRVDALQPGTGANDYVARIVGNGNGGLPLTTGWQIFQVDLGTLAAGTHTVTIGVYNNQKTFNDEVTEVLVDDVVVSSTGPPVLTSITVTPASATVPLGGTQAFTAEGRDQYGSPIATTVSWTVSGGGSIDASGRFTASSTGGPFVVTARDGAVSGTASVTVVADAGILEAHFDTGSDGFVYLDDAFRGTSRPGYASGLRSASEGFSGGGLKVTLGGIDDTTVLGMSGGWRRSFTLPSAGPVTLSFRYKLSQAANYEPDELSEALVTVDALQPGTGANDYVARIVGDENGGPPLTTGWQIFQVDLGTLAAGTHTLTIGGYNNQKTFNDEVTDVLVDDVVVR